MTDDHQSRCTVSIIIVSSYFLSQIMSRTVTIESTVAAQSSAYAHPRDHVALLRKLISMRLSANITGYTIREAPRRNTVKNKTEYSVKKTVVFFVLTLWPLTFALSQCCVNTLEEGRL